MRRRALLLLLPLLASCEQTGGAAFARRISSPTELIGGPGALGAVGDYVIGNSKFRVIIQDQGWSRGFGVFGGAILDADLMRASSRGTSDGGTGKDNFGEFFPALFLQAFDVQDQKGIDAETLDVVDLAGIEVLEDGSDGGEAIIRTRALGGDFLTLVSDIVGSLIPKAGLRFETDYIVRPGTRHVEVVGRLRNISGKAIPLPSGLGGVLEQLAEGLELQVPLGDVALFGAGNDVFAPGAVMREGRAPKPVGFDIRFAVETAYGVPRSLPALPGLVVDFLATTGPDVSYGFAAADSDSNYAWVNRVEYEKDDQVVSTRHGMVVPFLVSSFTGAFYELPPEELAPLGQPGDVFEYKRYFVVGNGDVASVRDELYQIRGSLTGRLQGVVVNEQTARPETEAAIVILDAEGRPYSQVKPNADGRFTCRLEPGTYSYRVTAPGRYTSPAPDALEQFSIEAGGLTELPLSLPPPAELSVRVRDSAGQPLPAKVSLVSRYEASEHGKDPMEFLFDLSLGERRRATDLSWRNPTVEQNRQFVEEVLYTANGLAHGPVRPSCRGDVCRDYDIVVSRGPEYDLFVIDGVRLEAGVRRELDATLTRTVNTDNWIAADLHVHSIGSVDSFLALDDRVISAAAEGLEMPVSTDHNVLVDYRPTIEALGLHDWVTTATGVELSTLEMGHFNSFPLRYDVGSPSHFPYVGVCNAAAENKVNKTAFDWVECAPGKLFENLRALGRYGPEETIVQVNHPRDTILGYFNQYYVNPYTAVAEEPDPLNYPETGLLVYPHDRVPNQFQPQSFSFDFDAIEVLNGKRLDSLHGFKIANDTPQERIDELRDICNGGHPDNGLDADGNGKLRLRNGGHIAFPGAVDDWLRMLNNGYKITATSNSDSHRLSAQVGFPRTYLWVEPSSPTEPRDLPVAAVTELDLVHAIKDHRAVATNGPFLEMWVLADVVLSTDAGLRVEKRPWPIGSTVKYACNPDLSGSCQGNIGREVEVLFHLRSAPWIDVDEIVVWANGEILERIPISDRKNSDGTDIDDDDHIKRGGPTYVFDRDVVLVAEAVGHESLFPVVPPEEEPPTNLGQALGGLAGGLGLDVSAFGSGDGFIAPTHIQKTTPYALTNPIWIDVNGDGQWTPPGNDPGPGPAPRPAPGSCPDERRRQRDAELIERFFSAPNSGRHDAPPDIRRVFRGHSPQ